MAPPNMLHRNPVDLSDGRLRDDPYPLYAELRESDPVHRSANGPWMLTRYDHCNAALRDPRLSSDSRNASVTESFTEPSDVWGGTVAVRPWLFYAPGSAPDGVDPPFLFRDPPDHTRLRRLVARSFTPRAVQRWRPRVELLADQLVSHAARSWPVELVGSVAYPLPVTVICELLGVPPEDHAAFHAWSAHLARVIEPEGLQDRQQREATRQAVLVLGEYLSSHLVAPPEGSLLEELGAASEGEQLTVDELLATCVLLLVAGHETTVNLIANGALALLGHRDQLARLVTDPDTAEAAVDELMRYDSPVQIAARTARCDIDLEDRTIHQGEQVLIILGAANRDPRVFPQPDRLDLDRTDAHRQLGFGSGIHHCLGASLARLEAAATFTRIAPHLQYSHIAASTRRAGRLALRGLTALTLTQENRP
jgi:cytochrome P450